MMSARDLLREASAGLRSRWLRTALCALGIALGVAAVVVVLAVPASTQRDLLATLGRDGNLLTVASGRTIANQPSPLPSTAPVMLRRVSGVEQVSAVSYLPSWIARRTPYVPVANTNGISVMSAVPSLVSTLNLRLVRGHFLNPATARFPVLVLGSGAAAALGVTDTRTLVYLSGSDGRGGTYFTVAGVLAPVALAPELDTAVLIGTPASAALGADGLPTRVYLRSNPDQVASVRGLLAPTASPSDPGSVAVGRPSDLLVARVATRGALNSLALGLGAVALLIGGVGVANAMVVSVLERRSEIGLRRALGATRRAVGGLVMIESTLLCMIGALAGVGLGVLAALGYASARDIAPVLPLLPILAGLGGSVVVGVVAGLYPAARAARLSPTAALRTV